MIKNWHIVVTRSRFEKKCTVLLDINSIESYLPIHNVLTQWSDRKKWVEKPLFPGYLFVKFSASERHKVQSTEGIAKIIQFEKKDYIINESVINGIKDLLLNKKEVVLIETLNLNIGDEVIIKSGPFIGAKGKLTKVNGKSKIIILIEAINQGCVLEINGTEVEKV